MHASTWEVPARSMPRLQALGSSRMKPYTSNDIKCIDIKILPI